MRHKAMVALGRLVLSKRERVIALEPYDKGLLGTTLRYPYEQALKLIPNALRVVIARHGRAVRSRAGRVPNQVNTFIGTRPHRQALKLHHLGTAIARLPMGPNVGCWGM
jgi:hypothetical protein